MPNLLDPAILFFVFGVLAGTVKSNLEIPPHMYLSDTRLLIGEDKKA